jgi:hypothetical protein
MNTLSKIFVLQALFVTLAACGGGQQDQRGVGFIGGVAPALSWTAVFASGTQTGPISFQSIGQTATLTMTTPLGTSVQPGPPYTVNAGSCVTLGSAVSNGTESVMSAASGSCTITVTNTDNEFSTIQATVP